MTALPQDDLWLFGYGSLIWKADFDYASRTPATLTGWSRRFWQGSHDHRGTPDAPGRVVTLIESPQERCTGMAYCIAADRVADVLEHLDFREKNGYERLEETVEFTNGGTQTALVYIATPDNFAHLGDASDEHIAQQIHQSTGPSGTNREYLFELHEALLKLDAEDAHVAQLFDLVRRMG